MLQTIIYLVVGFAVGFLVGGNNPSIKKKIDAAVDEKIQEIKDKAAK